MVECNTLLRMHFPHLHFNFFAVILGDVSDEHSGGFHEEISTLDKRCQGKWKLTATTDSFKEQLRICIQENQAEKDFKHVKFKYMSSISLSKCYTK